ncbi:MAG TPA: asparagine synthase-related protein [Bryobacteraceae bacterium]
MSIRGASRQNRTFFTGAPTSRQAFWYDDVMALAGSDRVLTCVHEKLALFLDGRLFSKGARLLDILQAYTHWGVEFPRYIQGDFALALWDSENRRLVLARDVTGYRPLHYWIRGGEFRFASEARGLFAHGDITPAANPERIAQWLSGSPATSGATFFRDILTVPMGHTVVWERGRVTVRDFWQPAKIPCLRLADPREYADGLRSVLEEAVRDRISGFSAVGSHLSGGLDSSSVTATAAKILQDRGGRVTAFTAAPTIAVDDAGFPRRFCDETAHAASTAALYPNINHVVIPNLSGNIFGSLDRMSSASECPQLNPGNSAWFLAMSADASSRGLRVMLTGANGNFTISWDGRRALSGLIASGRIVAAARLASAMRSNGSRWSAAVKSGVRPLLPSPLLRMLGSLSGRQHVPAEIGVRREFAANFGLDPEEAAGWIESLDGRSLRIWALRDKDFGGHMAGLRSLTGVEQMDPTADRRVMEFCLSVPEEHYCANGRGRSLIREAMSGILPPRVLEERRKGRQSADLVFHLAREKGKIMAELQRLKKIDLAVRCLDLPALDELVQAWPAPPYGHREYLKYGTQLMRAISMGRFIRRMEEGTLFRDQDSAAA